MRNISSAFSRALMADKRDYKNRLVVTLANGFSFTVDNSRIWDDGVKLQDAVSADNVFQIGAAIINQATFILNNIYGDYDEYSFDGAKIVAYIGLTDLDDGTSEEIKLGTFEVDETQYNGSLITLTCLDYMARFDRAYTFDRSGDWTITYPNTLEQIVLNACHNCNVSLDSLSLNFPHKDYVVTKMPSGENTTYRQVISWAAQIACCYARCNVDGKLEIKWYETGEFDNLLNWLDGGVFDGIDISWLNDYLNTDAGMTAISTSPVDDQWFRIDNSIEFPFNGYTSNYIYIDSDSCFAFADTQPSNHGHNSLKDVNICTRDGQSISIKYQEISVAGKNAIKVRFSGYTRYGSSYRTAEYALEYEIFFTDNRQIIINYITLPTNTSYFGTSSIIENTISTAITPTTSSILAYYQDDNNNWTGGSVSGAYITGDTADGGSFNPWDTGDVYDGGTFRDRNSIHFITSSYSSNIATDSVVITGVKVIKKIKAEGQSDAFIEYTSGTTGYVVVIENNDFIDGTHGQDIANWIGLAVNGLSFRKASITHPNDPSIEAGDVALYFDLKGNIYPMLVSSTTFSPGNSQQTASSAETPKKNSSQRFTETTRNYVEMRQQMKQQMDDVQVEIEERLAQASGLYCTEVTQSGATITYYHDKSLLADSNIVMEFSDVGFTMTSNYQDEHPTWYGMTVDGQMIASILNTTGINADWINTGTITIGGTVGNKNGSLIIKDANGNTIGTFNKNGISVKADIQSSSTISGATVSGTAVSGGTISGATISGNTISGGTISGTTFTGGNISIGNGKFVVDNNGVLTSNDASIKGTISSVGTGWGHPTVTLNNGDVDFTNDYASDKAYINTYVNTVGTVSYIGLQISAKARIQIGDPFVKPGLYVFGELTCSGGKPRLVETKNYGARKLYAYETPTPYFGDIGTGITDSDGIAIISIDDIFNETVNTNVEYCIFLQKEGNGDLWIDKKDYTFFIVKGTPNLKFSWELKVVQRDYEQYRLNDDDIDVFVGFREDDAKLSMEKDLDSYDNEQLFDDSELDEEIPFGIA